MPSSMRIRLPVKSSSCGMYSTYLPFWTAQVRLTCSSIRKCGTDRHVEGLRRMRDLEPGRDAADAARHRPARSSRRLSACIRGNAGSNRAIRRSRSASCVELGQPDMAVDVVGRQRLLDPGEIELAKRPGASDRLVDRKALVGVGHDLVAVADRLAHRRQAGDSPRMPCGLPILTFEPRSPWPCAASASSTSAFVSICSQPPSVV